MTWKWGDDVSASGKVVGLRGDRHGVIIEKSTVSRYCNCDKDNIFKKLGGGGGRIIIKHQKLDLFG